MARSTISNNSPGQKVRKVTGELDVRNNEIIKGAFGGGDRPEERRRGGECRGQRQHPRPA